MKIIYQQKNNFYKNYSSKSNLENNINVKLKLYEDKDVAAKMENNDNLKVNNKKITLVLVICYLVSLVCLGLLVFYVRSSNNIVLIEKFISLKKLSMIGGGFLTVFFPLVYFVKTKTKITWDKFLFYGVMMFFISVTLIAGYITHGESIRSMLADDPHDTLMDFFNSIQYGLKPYTAKVIYPPLINVFYGLLGRFMVKGADMYAMRVNQLGTLVFGMYVIITYGLLIHFINKFKEGSLYERILFILVALFSLPFLYLYDRANSVILAILALILYCFYYDSVKKKYRFLAFIALGIATGIKIAPAIYGAILLREKRFKDAFWAFLIGVIIFIFPFALTDGNPSIMLQNISYTTGLMQEAMLDPATGIYRLTGNGHYVNLLNTCVFLGRLFNFNSLNVANCLNVCMLLFGTFVVIFVRQIEYWKAICILTCIIILFPGFSAIYNLTYMLIPLILFLNSKPKFTKLNLTYMVLFLLLFIPFVNLKIPLFKIFFNDWHQLTLMTAIESISLLLMMVVLLLEGFYVAYNSKIKKYSLKYKVCIGICLILCVIGIYGWKCGFNQRAIDVFYPHTLKAINAQHGFTFYKGQYIWLQNKADILLKSDGICKNGLIINLTKPNEGKKENVESWDELKIFVNDVLLITKNNITEEGAIIYIEPQKIKNIVCGDTILVRLERNGGKQSRYVDVSYIGPANLTNQLTVGVPFQNISEGFNVYEDNNLWINSKARVILDSDNLIKKGLLVTVQAPKALLEANRDKQIKLDILVDDKIIKDVNINDVDEKTIAIDSDLLKMYIDKYDEPVAVNVGFAVNSTFNSRKMTLDTNRNDRSLIVKYIGPCSDLPVGNSVKFSQNKRFYFDVADLEGQDLNIIYKVLPSQFINNEELILTALVNNEKIYTNKLNKLDYDNLNMIYIPNKKLTKKDGITELEIAVTGVEQKNENIVIISYIGKNQLVGKLTDKNDNDYMDYHYISSGLDYDKDSNSWMMGSTGQFLLPADLLNSGVSLKYNVPKELFIANPGCSDITLSVMINGNKVKDVLLDKPGDFELLLRSEEISPFINAKEGYFNVRLYVNSVYNLQKLKVRHKNIDQSIDIRYFGKPNY